MVKVKCMDIEKNIPQFIERNLDYKDTIAFLEHVNKCPACKEELSIEFLVVNGLKKLDSAEAFDLQKDLNSLMKESSEWAEKKKRTRREVVMFGIFVVLVACYVIALTLQ